ncbi:unnamed protein product [Closterium sp. Naga37s-1]|nr:unnamed protein product [Closterium sp. Naga37s-1]
MASELDQSLDDIIKSKKSSGRGGSRGGRGSGPGRGYGPVRRSGRGGFRSTPYGQPAAMVTDRAWQHDIYDAGAVAVPAAGRAAGQGIETGTKLYVSNLDYGVSNDDVKELFSEIGELKRFSVHYDRSGRSKGTAEVVFARKADALAAMTRYNNVQLDGKPMKIELIGSTVAPAVPPVARVAVAPAIVAPFGFPAG